MPASFHRNEVAEKCRSLAGRGVYLGTSSWKYTGWCGQLYDEERYAWRGKLSEAKFNRGCLSEYAEVFNTVCVDAAYYKFPTRSYLEAMADQVPDDFLFAFKVTDEITIKKFSNLPRFGVRAGRANENFLNAQLFATAFLGPCESIRSKVGLLMFEFSRFYPSDFPRGRDFIEALEPFLAALPKGWPYGIEIRNKTFLHPEYFSLLRRHGVTHIFNSWQLMPSVPEQAAMPGSRTTPERVAARFLLKPGRKYQDAVDRFSPYNEMKEINQEARTAGAGLIKETVSQSGKNRAFLYVNNRLEGNALETIAAMIENAELKSFPGPRPGPAAGTCGRSETGDGPTA